MSKILTAAANWAWARSIIKPLLALPILLGVLVSCAKENLSIFSEYVTVNSLASYHIDTPDPLLNNPPVGQRIFISWDLPKSYNCYEDLHLELSVRFRNKEEDSLSIKLCKLYGTYVYGLYNDDFFNKDGILTYKIVLVGDGEALDEWRHQLWVEKILFPETSPSLYEEDDCEEDWFEDPDQKIEFIS